MGEEMAHLAAEQKGAPCALYSGWSVRTAALGLSDVAPSGPAQPVTLGVCRGGGGGGSTPRPQAAHCPIRPSSEVGLVHLLELPVKWGH